MLNDTLNTTIKYVELGSVAEEMGIGAGDKLLAINDKPIVDIMDYLYHRDDDEIVLTIEKSNGEVWQVDIEKNYNETVGIVFENPIIDTAKQCTNRCIFCFVDQMPKGMRKTLYFKDDDSRLSFMMGNFVTLTNLNDKTFQRIIDYRISPINISVHTVDSTLRVKMLGNRFAGNIKERLMALYAANIKMNGQVVLCPSYNDGAYLDETIDFLSGLYPNMISMAVVPVGMTRYREGLAQLTSVDNEKAYQVIEQIANWQSKLLKKIGTRFVFAADEFFLRAKCDIPDENYYEGYIQIENGVGLIRKFENEAFAYLHKTHVKTKNNEIRVIYALTSVDAYDMMIRLSKAIKVRFSHIELHPIAIVNHFFGTRITVSGLITAQDITNQIGKQLKNQYVIMPQTMLNSDNVFLDDKTVKEVECALEANIKIVEIDGRAFIKAVLGGN